MSHAPCHTIEKKRQNSGRIEEGKQREGQPAPWGREESQKIVSWGRLGGKKMH